MSLKTGVELICIFTVFNKASGLYGLLALITGAPISGWQMSMYLYSIIAAIAFAYSLRHIKAGSSSAFEIVAFAWLCIFDTLINFGFTALFATTWFLVLSQQTDSTTGAAMNETAGFTNPTNTVASVDVLPTLDSKGNPVTALAGTSASSPPGLGGSVLHPEQYPSIFALAAILFIKLYFILVVLSYARQMVRAVDGDSITRYSGWKSQCYQWMTKGRYWRPKEDLRLSKTRSSRRSDEVRR